MPHNDAHTKIFEVSNYNQAVNFQVMFNSILFDNPLSQIAIMLEFKLFFSAHLGRG
jgi:hypothetical protein